MVMETIKRNPIPPRWRASAWSCSGRTDRPGCERYQRPVPAATADRAARLSMLERGATAARTSARRPATPRRPSRERRRCRRLGGRGRAAGCRQAIDRAGRAAQEVGWKLENFMQANPIAVGVIAAGAGAVVGSLVPETPQERECSATPAGRSARSCARRSTRPPRRPKRRSTAPRRRSARQPDRGLSRHPVPHLLAGPGVVLPALPSVFLALDGLDDPGARRVAPPRRAAAWAIATCSPATRGMPPPGAWSNSRSTAM